MTKGYPTNPFSINPLGEKLAWNPLDENLASSSILHKGPDVVSIFSLLISTADRYGVSHLTAPFLATSLGISLERVKVALEILQAPDPESRNKAHEGRRILPDPEDGWILTSHAKYRAKISALKAAERQARYRERQKQAES